jgi:hypothetical protein
MKSFIMAIVLCQMDVRGYIYFTHMKENPLIEYNSYKQCKDAADIKKEKMLISSLKYPEMEIVDVFINCQMNIDHDNLI